MEKRRFTREAFEGVHETVKSAGGDTSFAGRQHIRNTGKLHALVDPAGYELVRKSWPRYFEQDGSFVLTEGVPMLVENRLDTTGSMRENVKLAFDSLPKQYDLLAHGKHPVLGRYDPQILNGIFGDVQDNYVLMRSQAEMDEKIPQQLTLMVPEGGGGDEPEDPEYGIFGGAYLTDAFVCQYGLKYYDFTITDATSHGRIDRENLVRVFGPTVFKRVADNGNEIDEHNLPDAAELVRALKKRAHAFVIAVRSQETARYWRKYYGKEHTIFVPSTEYLAYVEAAVIGLTEGVLDLQMLPGYLAEAGCDKEAANEIQRAVAGIPLGAQAALPNFGKIPKKGTVFKQKHDLWPVADAAKDGKAKEAETTWL